MNIRQRAWLLPPAALCLCIGIMVGRRIASPLLPCLACVPALAAVILLRGRLRFAACLVLFLSFGAASGQVAFHPVVPPEGNYEVRGIISDEIRHGQFDHVSSVLTNVSLDGRPVSADAYWSFYMDEAELPPDLEPGREVSFYGSVYAPSGASNPDGYDFREDLLRRGATFGIYGAENLAVTAASSPSFAGLAASLRHRISIALLRQMGEETGGYASALLLGNRSLVPSEDRAAFSRIGVAHILSVSGFHVGILVLVFSCLFRLLHLRQSLRLFLYGAVLLLYCGLCGMNQPVVRASLLLLLLLTGKILNRPRVGLHALCAVMIVMLVLSPVQLTGFSFLLSFGAMFGIVLLMPRLEQWNPFSNRILRRLWSSLAMVLSVQLGILLPELYAYQKLPLLSLLVNLPVTFAATVLILLDWIAFLLLPLPFLSDVSAAAASLFSSLFLRGVRVLSAVPGITLWTHASTWLTVLGMVPVYYALSSLFRLSIRRRLACLAAGLAVTCLSLLPQPHNTTEYIQFSVGNADAAILWDQDAVYVMDTGSDDGVLSGFLRRHRLTPDAVILTHLHSDHAGGLQSLVEDEIPVRRLYLPAGAENQQIHEDILFLLDTLRAAGTEIHELSRGDRLPLPSGDLTVLWPEAGRVRHNQDANNYSLVFLLDLCGVSFLQTGDITGLYESYSAVPADLMKAPHHGSSASCSPEFLEKVSPLAVLLSCGRLSRHEDYKTRIGDMPLWSTAVHGAVTVRFFDHTFSVHSVLSGGN